MLLFLITIFLCCSINRVNAETAANIDLDVDVALQKLYTTNSAAKNISEAAKAILVFPNIIKGGLIIGGQYGTGALRIDGTTTAYYSSIAASYGLQIGAQTFGYAMFFMTDSGLDYLRKSKGWEVGVGPTVVVVDQGGADSFSTSTFKEDILVFFFNQKGLMAGLSIEGSKITPYVPDPQ